MVATILFSSLGVTAALLLGECAECVLPLSDRFINVMIPQVSSVY